MRIAACLIVLVAMAAPAQAQDPVRHGRALVGEFCASCHAVGPRGRSPHWSAPPFHALGRSFDLDDFPRLLVRGISATHPDMPEIRFNEDDARAVRDYLRTIQH
jgi:mono/diheme cytochrome c family protein